MSNYQSPSIVELGTVADFTRNDTLAWDFDGMLFHGDTKGGGGQPTS